MAMLLAVIGVYHHFRIPNSHLLGYLPTVAVDGYLRNPAPPTGWLKHVETCWNPINNGILPIKSINFHIYIYIWISIWISPQHIPIEIPIEITRAKTLGQVQAKRTVAAGHPATFLGTREVSEAPRGDLRWRSFSVAKGLHVRITWLIYG